MSIFERLLERGCTELPACRCGQEMKLVRVDPISIRDDAKIQIYHCSKCEHELRLTVWAVDAVESSPPLAPVSPHNLPDRTGI